MAGCLYARYRTDATRRTWCVWNDGSIPHFARCISKLVFRLKLRQHNMTKIEGARGPLVELCSIRWLKDHRIGWFGSFRFAPPAKLTFQRKTPGNGKASNRYKRMGYYPTVINTITLMIWKPCESRKAIQQWWECQAAYRGCIQSLPRNSGLPCAEMLRSPYSDWSLERIGWSDMSMEQSTDDVPVNKHRISWNPSSNVFEVFVQLSVCSGSF